MPLIGNIYNSTESNDRELWRRSLAEIGLNLVEGSFQKGATVTGATDAVWDIDGAQCYTWTGGFPHTAEDSPGAGWVSVGGLSLRDYVLQKLDNIGNVVYSGDELKSALENADDGEVVIVSGDITLNQSIIISKAVSIRRVKGGRILWNGSGNNCILYRPQIKKKITTPTQFLRATNVATLPSGHGILVGDCLQVVSNSVRYEDATDGSYTHGQIVFVEAVDGNKVTFVPSIVNGFTSSEITVTPSLVGMDFDVEINTIKPPSGNATGVLLDIQSARGMNGKFKINGNGDEQYGLAIMGYNCHYTADVWDITSGSGTYAAPGYGVNVVGNTIHGVVTGGRCRHIVEVPSRTILSDDIKFDVNVTKSDKAPLFLYAAGWHANVENIKITGTISGSGFLLGVRSGTGEVDVNFIGADDGYDYSDIYVANKYPTTLKIKGNSSGVNARRNFVHWDVNGQSSNSGGLRISGSSFIGPKRIVRFTDTSGLNTKSFRAFISDCKGDIASIHNRDLANSNVYLELNDNELKSYGVAPSFPDFMAGVDAGGCKSYEVRSSKNNVDDSGASGVFSFDGYMDAISFSSSDDKNTTKPFIRMAPTYLGRIDRLDLDGLDTAGQVTLTPTSTTVYNDIGHVRFSKIGYNAPNPIIVGLSWPVVYTSNSFKTTLDVTLISTKKPQGANVNLSGKAINWNGSNIGL